MSQEETLRYKVQVDMSEAQPVVQNMVSSIGQAFSTTIGYAQAGFQGAQNTFDTASSAIGGSYNSIQAGYNMAAPSFSGAYNSLSMGAMHAQQARQMYSGGATAGVYQEAQNAAAAFDDPGRNIASTLATGAAYGSMAIVGWTGVQAFGDGIEKFGNMASGQYLSKADDLVRAGRYATRGEAVAALSAGGYGGLGTLGARMGSGMMDRLGLGAVGRGLGYAAGRLAGMMLPSMAADAVINRVMDDVLERNEAANAIGSYDEVYRGPFSGGGKGSRFSKSQRLSMADFMKDYSEEIDRADFGQGKMGYQGLTQVLHGFQKEIFSDPSLSPKKFREIFTKKVEMVRDFSMAFDKTIGESVEIIKQLQSATGTQDPRQTAAMVGMSAHVSGLSTIGMIGVAQRGGQSYLSSGLSQITGANVSIQGAADFGSMNRLGMIGKDDFNRLGGVQGLTNLQVSLQGAFTSGPYGQMIAAAALKNGKVYAATVNNIISGQVGTGQMLGMASGLAGGGINALSNFFSNSDQMVQQLSATQQQGLVGSMAIRMLNMTGMDINQSNLQTVFASQFGMSQSAARVFAERMMNPQIYQHQMNATIDKMDQKAMAAEANQHTMGAYLYRVTGMETAGRALSSAGGWLRREVANPLGNGLDAVGRGWTRLKDRITGTQRVTLDSGLNDIDNLYTDSNSFMNLSFEDRAGNLSSNNITSRVLGANFKQVKAAAISAMGRGGKTPNWIKTVLNANWDVKRQLNLGLLSKQEVDEIASGFRSESMIMRDLQMGQSSGDAIAAKSALSKNANFIRGVSELLQEQEDGVKLTSASAAQKIISRGGIFGLKRGASLSELTSTQRQELGAMMSRYGIETDDRKTGTGRFNLDLGVIREMQKRAKKAEADLGDMVRGRSWFSRHFSDPDKEKSPFEFAYGSGFTNVMRSQSKEVQGKAVQALSILSKGESATKEDREKASRLLEEMRDVRGTLRGRDRAAFSKIVVDLERLSNGNPSEITKNVTALGKRFRAKADSIVAAMSVSGKMLASKAQATQFSRRITMEMIADDRGGAKENILKHIKGKKGLSADDLETILKKVGDIGEGDVGQNLMEFGKMYGEKKYKEIFEIMKIQGGAYGKIAELAGGLSVSRELQGRDLLSGVLDKDKNLKDMISGSTFKGALQNRKSAREQYERIISHIKKTNPTKYNVELSQIERTLESTTDERERLLVLKKIIEGKSDTEWDLLSRIQLRAVSGKVGGSIVSGPSSAGTYSKVAEKQIQVSQQVLQNLRIQHQTMKALYQQIKNSGK